MKKYLTSLFPLILFTVPAYAAPQWSCPKCTKDQVKPIFEKYASGDKLTNMLNVFDKNLTNGILNTRAFVRTCHAAGFKGPIDSEGYKKCESFVKDMSKLATQIPTSKSGAKMSECESDVRFALINKGELSAGAIVDGLKKSCKFDDSDSYLFKGVTVSGTQAMALASLLGRKQCRVDSPNGILVCDDRYAYIFSGIDNNNKINATRANNIAKAVCAIDTKTAQKNSDLMSFDDNVKGCPTPQVVANCKEFQKQLQKINASLTAKEHKEYAQTYCVAGIKSASEDLTYSAHLNDFANEEGPVDMAVALIEGTFPKLTCSHYNWYEPTTGIYSIFCEEKGNKKQTHGFRFKRLWCSAGEKEFEYDPKTGGCKQVQQSPSSCTPQSVDTNIFAAVTTTMPMQAIAMANRYLLKRCHKYQCGEWPSGTGVKCGQYEFRFKGISNSAKGSTANHSIAEAFCRIYDGSYGRISDDYASCNLPSSTCSSDFRKDVQMVNSSIAVNYKDGQCILNWGTSKIDTNTAPQKSTVTPDIQHTEVFDGLAEITGDYSNLSREQIARILCGQNGGELTQFVNNGKWFCNGINDATSCNKINNNKYGIRFEYRETSYMLDPPYQSSTIEDNLACWFAD